MRRTFLVLVLAGTAIAAAAAESQFEGTITYSIASDGPPRASGRLPALPPIPGPGHPPANVDRMQENFDRTLQIESEKAGAWEAPPAELLFTARGDVSSLEYRGISEDEGARSLELLASNRNVVVLDLQKKTYGAVTAPIHVATSLRPLNFTVTKLDNTKEILGYKCTEYQIRGLEFPRPPGVPTGIKGTVSYEMVVDCFVWVTDEIKANIVPFGGLTFGMGGIGNALANLPGVPLVIGGGYVHIEATKISTDRLPADAFALPDWVKRK